MDQQTPTLNENERALIQAAIDGDAARVRALLSTGVNVNVRNAETHPLGLEWNTTALMCAAAKGHVEVVRLLLAAGADVSAATEAHKVDGGPGGSQALHHALDRDQVEAARLLLDAGADPDGLGRYGRSPLTSALVPMSLAGVQLVLKHGAKVNLKAKRKDYQPPLYAASSSICSTTSMVSRNGKMVLEVAAIWERKDQVLEIFRLLLAAGADANATGPRQRTALATLAFCHQMPDELRIPLIEMLLAAGARPDQVDKDGDTALSTAKLRPHQRVIELLSRPLPPPGTAAKKPGGKPKR